MKKRKIGRPSLGLEKQAFVTRITPRQRRVLKRIVANKHASSLGAAVRWLIDREAK